MTKEISIELYAQYGGPGAIFYAFLMDQLSKKSEIKLVASRIERHLKVSKYHQNKLLTILYEKNSIAVPEENLDELGSVVTWSIVRDNRINKSKPL